MVSKMHLKELDKNLERLKEKTLVKSHQGSSVAKRKGKEPMTAPSKKRRALVLEDEEDEGDITIFVLALRNLQSAVPETKEREDQDRDEEEERSGERESM